MKKACLRRNQVETHVQRVIRRAGEGVVAEKGGERETECMCIRVCMSISTYGCLGVNKSVVALPLINKE
jgi:hypothetical protein